MEPLTFALEQHTPMLHFQASQQGATLRATDVKPRFDRWLIEKVWNNEFEKCCSFLVGYDKKFSADARAAFKKKFDGGYRALNYKMRIIVDDADENNQLQSTHTLNNKGRKMSSFPMYFGTEINTIRRRCSVSFIVLESVKDLIAYINENFSEFINSNNFGMRSSKGYGSFTVKSSDSLDAKLSKFPVLYVKLSGNKWKDILKQIDLFYKSIRSGINFTQRIFEEGKFQSKDRKKGYYFKSMLYDYVENACGGKHWDKKIIKNHFLTIKHINVQEKYDYRDCLGLSTIEMWRHYNMSISKSVDNVGRFASPIVFKPVRDCDGWKVYIILKEIPDSYKGRKVTIKAKTADTKKDTRMLIKDFDVKPLTEMRIAKDFSIYDYFNYLFADPHGVSKKEWLEAKDIENRFDKYEMDSFKQTEIRQIVEFYKQLRLNYRKVVR